MQGFTVRRTMKCQRTGCRPPGHDAVVAIPARDEAAYLGRCLDALDRMHVPAATHLQVLLVLNGCTDASWDVATAWGRGHHLALTIVDIDLAAPSRHAGGARAAALALALEALGPDSAGSVLTTDADSSVTADWLVRALMVLGTGVDAVAGDVSVDDTVAAWPSALRQRHALESRYMATLDEIDALCDPVQHNPWPTHRRCFGANLAFRAEALRCLPRLPAPPCGEDRALIEACLSRGLRVRHDPGLRVETSGRLAGRASGGMADTLRQRTVDHALACDPMLEACHAHVQRACFRALARRTFVPRMSVVALAQAIGLPPVSSRQAPCLHFGEAWQRMERLTPFLVRTPLVPDELPAQIDEADAWLAAHRVGWNEEVAA